MFSSTRGYCLHNTYFSKYLESSQHSTSTLQIWTLLWRLWTRREYRCVKSSKGSIERLLLQKCQAVGSNSTDGERVPHLTSFKLICCPRGWMVRNTWLFLCHRASQRLTHSPRVYIAFVSRLHQVVATCPSFLGSLATHRLALVLHAPSVPNRLICSFLKTNAFWHF